MALTSNWNGLVNTVGLSRTITLVTLTSAIFQFDGDCRVGAAADRHAREGGLVERAGRGGWSGSPASRAAAADLGGTSRHSGAGSGSGSAARRSATVAGVVLGG